MPQPLAGQLDIELDRTQGRALVDQICGQLRAAMLSGRLPAGWQLPSSRELAQALGVARNTASAALDQLAMEGFLDVRQGRRPMVALPSGLQKAAARTSPRRPVAPRASQWANQVQASGWPFESGIGNGPFTPGFADAREFPHEIWARCLRSGARRAPAHSADELNHGPLREALLRHLSRERGVRAHAGRLFFTPSAQAALELCARLVIDAGDLAWMENPGYPGARAALLGAGASIAGVAVDEEGMAFGGRSDRPRAILVTPSHQYPTGVLMSAARRHELLRFAARAGAAIIEDDYDSEFHYEGKPVAALQGLDASGHVFYVGTFSKAMFNGVRVGYAVVPEPFAGLFEKAQRHAGQIVSPALQRGLAAFVERGHFAAHVRRMNRIYRARRDFLVQALRDRLGDCLHVSLPAGGMQVLATFKRPLDDVRVVRNLARHGVCARALSQLCVEAGGMRGLFLGFAAWTIPEMDAAVDRIRDAMGA